MKTQLVKQISLLACAAVLVAGFGVGAVSLIASAYRAHRAAGGATPDAVLLAADQDPFETAHAAYLYLNNDEPADLAEPEYEPENEPRITNVTTIVYEYFHLGDGVIERTEEMPPHFMLGMTRDVVEGIFAEWEITDFTDTKLVMRKYVDSARPGFYIVGLYEGYIAVFYENGVLREVTGRSAAGLPLDEQERLREGIHVVGLDKLIKVLQDYSS